MSIYVRSAPSISTELSLWGAPTTNTAIVDNRSIEVYPLASIESSDTVSFVIPPLPNQMLDHVEIVVDLRVLTANGTNPAPNQNVGTQPMLSASLFRNVDVTIGNTSLLQSYDYSACCFKFWETVLNHRQGSSAYLKHKEGLILDHVSKLDSEDTIYHPVAVADEDVPAVVNHQGKHRANRIKEGRIVHIITDLDFPVFKGNKLLPPNLAINVALTKSPDEFILLSAANDTSKIVYDKIALRCHFKTPAEPLLHIIEERLSKENAVFRCDKKTMSTIPLTQGARSVTLENVFRGTLPYYFLIGVQGRPAFGRNREKNAFTLHKIQKCSVYLNNIPIFSSAVHLTEHDLTQGYCNLISNTGSINQGDTLLHNAYGAYPALAVDLTRDSSMNQLGMNLSRHGSVRILLEFDQELPANRCLMVLGWYERLIEITKDRDVIVV